MSFRVRCGDLFTKSAMLMALAISASAHAQMNDAGLPSDATVAASTRDETPGTENLDTVPVQVGAESESAPLPKPSSGNRLVEEIIVTAQKREENIQDVPLSIQAFSSDMLDAVGVLSTQDLPKVTPGLTVTAQVGYATTFLRGIGSDSFLLADPSVATYIDGVYNPFALGQFSDFGDVERIEVLKGPQGTLFGRNAVGGAVNILTKKPSLTEPVISLQTIYGSFDASKSRALISVPLTDDFAVSLSGVYNSADSHIKGLSAGEPLARNVGKAARVKLLYEPAEWFEFQFNALRGEQDGSGTLYAPNTAPSTLGTLAGIRPQDPYAGSVNELVYSSIDNTTLSGQTRVGLPWFDAKLLASKQRIKVVQPYDFDGSAVPIAKFVGDPGFSRSRTAELQILSNQDSWGAEWLQWIAGAYYFKSKQGFDPAYLGAAATDLNNGVVLGIPVPPSLLDLIRNNLGGVPIPSGTVAFTGVIGTESIAYFTQATVDLTDWAALTLGGRYQDEDREIVKSTAGLLNSDGSITLIPGQNYSAEKDPSLADTTRSFDPKVSLSFHPEWSWLGDSAMLYVSWQKATKSSTYNVFNIYDAPDYVKPEKIEAYEAGIKTRLLDGLVTLNAAAFRYELQNQQVQLVSLLAGGAVQFENAGSLRTVGFETDAVIQLFPSLIDDLVFSGGAAVLDAKYTSYPSGSGFDPTTGLLTGNNDYTGNQVVRSPDLSGNATLLKTFHMESGSIEVAADYYYNSGFFYLAQGTANVEEKAYATVGARLSYLYEPWNFRVTVFGQNLTSTEYNLGRFPTDFGTQDARAPKANYGLRLNWDY